MPSGPCRPRIRYLFLFNARTVLAPMIHCRGLPFGSHGIFVSNGAIFRYGDIGVISGDKEEAVTTSETCRVKVR